MSFTACSKSYTAFSKTSLIRVSAFHCFHFIFTKLSQGSCLMGASWMSLRYKDDWFLQRQQPYFYAAGIKPLNSYCKCFSFFRARHILALISRNGTKYVLFELSFLLIKILNYHRSYFLLIIRSATRKSLLAIKCQHHIGLKWVGIQVRMYWNNKVSQDRTIQIKLSFEKVKRVLT